MREALGDDAATRRGAIVPCEDAGALGAAIALRLQDPALRASEESHAPRPRRAVRAGGLGRPRRRDHRRGDDPARGRDTMTEPDRHLKILMVSSLWPPHLIGGAELYASTLAEQLRVAGHEVAVVTLGVPGPDVVAEVPARPYRLDEFATQPPTRRAVFHALDVYRPSHGPHAHRNVRGVPARRRAHALGAGPVERGAGDTVATRYRARTHTARLLAALSAHYHGCPRRYGVRASLWFVFARLAGAELDHRPAPSTRRRSRSPLPSPREHERIAWLVRGCGSCRTPSNGSRRPRSTAIARSRSVISASSPA